MSRPSHKKWTAGLILSCAAFLQPAAKAQFESRSSSVALGQPCCVAVGDFNGDNNLDLAVAAFYSGQVAVLLGNSDGTFRPAVYYPVSDQIESLYSIATADLRKNGNLDLVVADYLDGNISVLLGNGDGTFQPARPYSTAPWYPTFVAVGDFGGAYPDLAIILDGPPFIVGVMNGNGDGSFQVPITTPTSYDVFGLGIGDFNDDGKSDLAAAEFFGGVNQVEILLGNGNGTFSAQGVYGVGAAPQSVAVADFRDNGKLDLAVGDFEGPGVSILLGKGNGTFASAVNYTSAAPLWVSAADLNGDGKPDLAIANGGILSRSVSVLIGNGDGTFQAGASYPVGEELTFVAIGDFNGDNKNDLVVTDYLGNSVFTLLNTGVVSFTPTTPVQFPFQLVGATSPPRTVMLTNTGKSPLKISSLSASGQFELSDTCGKSVAAGARCQLSVTFLPKTQGAKSGLITIHDSASTKPQIIELSGSGTVVELSPLSLNFGTQKVGTKSAPRQVQLTNTGSSPLSISKLSNGNDASEFPETNNCPASLGARASCTITVTFAPKKTGLRADQISITDNGGGSPQFVPLKGTGD